MKTAFASFALFAGLLFCPCGSTHAQANIGGGGFGSGSAFIPPPRDQRYNTNHCVYPYRKFGDKYCDLRPLFNWIRLPAKWRAQRENPMPEWQVYIFQITDILPEGLLVTSIYGDGTYRHLVRNHPDQAKLKDHQLINCLLQKLPTRFRYQDVRGGIHTVDQYDFGEIFDPAQLAREAAQKKAAK